MTREHIIDILGQEVRVGDRVAAAVTGGYDKSAKLVVGTVERFTATRTVLRVEKRTGWASGDTSVVQDRLGRIVKLEAAA